MDTMRRVVTVFMIMVATTLAMVGAKAQKEVQGEPAVPIQNPARFVYTSLNPELYNSLNPFETQILLKKGTERAFTGAYTDKTDEGTYYCRQCNTPLYASQDKFHSGCGWPAFDDELPFAVERHADADGMRTEIVCATCGGHLGHVFTGEGFTEKDTRHCVNSASLSFRPGKPEAIAVFAGGCFWGVEFLFEKLEGVQSARSGYTGGALANPSYQDVLTHASGHLEAVEVTYDPRVISYEQLARYFFEIHDPTQTDGQGPDIGNQYLSAVFYRNRHEFDTTVKLIGLLEAKGYRIATQIRPVAKFWPAETYHQDYYERKGTLPYCHAYVKRF